MIELQAKRLKLQGQSEKEQRKERESLKYRREEAERNRQHELQLTKMYMQMLGMPWSSFAQQPPINFGDFQGMSRYSCCPNSSDYASSTIEQFK